MLILTRGGELEPRIASDPRWSQAQREAAAAAAKADPGASVQGLDAKLRPVISARLEGPGGRTVYALMRNGAPAKPVKPLSETWRARRAQQ